MARKTKFIVYVDKGTMDKPAALFDAVYKHFIKKDEEKQKAGKKSNVDFKTRKLFMEQFQRAPEGEHQIKLINEWVQVRDIVTFPYRDSADNAPDKAGEEK